MAKEIEDSGSIFITKLSADEWREFRDLKIKSIEQEPIAFADPQPEKIKYLSRTEQEWRNILSGKLSSGELGETIMYFARDESQFIGMVSAVIPSDQSRKATIQHMFVDKHHRGRGIGRQLLEKLIVDLKGREDVDTAELRVVATQGSAISLYQSLGFHQVCIHKGEALRLGQRYNDIEMVLKT